MVITVNKRSPTRRTFLKRKKMKDARSSTRESKKNRCFDRIGQNRKAKDPISIFFSYICKKQEKKNERWSGRSSTSESNRIQVDVSIEARSYFRS